MFPMGKHYFVGLVLLLIHFMNVYSIVVVPKQMDTSISHIQLSNIDIHYTENSILLRKLQGINDGKTTSGPTSPPKVVENSSETQKTPTITTTQSPVLKDSSTLAPDPVIAYDETESPKGVETSEPGLIPDLEDGSLAIENIDTIQPIRKNTTEVKEIDRNGKVKPHLEAGITPLPLETTETIPLPTAEIVAPEDIEIEKGDEQLVETLEGKHASVGSSFNLNTTSIVSVGGLIAGILLVLFMFVVISTKKYQLDNGRCSISPGQHIFDLDGGDRESHERLRHLPRFSGNTTAVSTTILEELQNPFDFNMQIGILVSDNPLKSLPKTKVSTVPMNIPISENHRLDYDFIEELYGNALNHSTGSIPKLSLPYLLPHGLEDKGEWDTSIQLSSVSSGSWSSVMESEEYYAGQGSGRGTRDTTLSAMYGNMSGGDSICKSSLSGSKHSRTVSN